MAQGCKPNTLQRRPNSGAKAPMKKMAEKMGKTKKSPAKKK